MRNNVTRADNQQERQERLAESYIAGFVDGEGTFHVAFQRAPWTRFRQYPLHTTKRNDFCIFANVVRAMVRGEHLAPSGFRRIVLAAFDMNAHGSLRKYTPKMILHALESSETIRWGRQVGDKT